MKYYMVTSEKILLAIIKIGIFLLLFAPLIVSRHFFFPFVSPKGFYIMALSEIIVAAFLILILLFPKYRPSFNLVILSIALFIFALFLSTIFSLSFSKSFFSNYERMTGFLLYLHLFGLIFAVVSVLEKKDWVRIFFTSILIATVVSLLELINRVLGEGSLSIVSRGGSTLGNSSFFGTYLLFNIFFALYLIALFYKRKKVFIPVLAVFLFLSISLFLSGARAASYSFCGSLLLIFLFYISFCWPNPKIKFLGKIALFVTLFAIIFGIILLCIPKSIAQNQLAKMTSWARPLVWEIALKGIKERPLLGWGIQNFDLVFARYFNPCFFLKECGGEIWFDKAHNIIFDILIEAGILGLLSYLLIYLFSCGVLWQQYFHLKRNFWKASIFTSLLVAYFLQNLTVFDTPTSLLYFFLTLGFIARFEETNQEKETTDKNIIPKSRFRYCGALLILILLTFCFYEFVYLPAKSSFLFIQTKNIQDPTKRLKTTETLLKLTPFGKHQLRSYLAQNYLGLVKQNKASEKEGELLAVQLRDSLQKTPGDLKTALLLSNIYLTLSKDFGKNTIKLAQNIAEQAIKISPTNQQGYWLLAEIKLLEKDCKTAFYLAKYAYDLEPRVETSLSVLSTVWNSCKDALTPKE